MTASNPPMNVDTNIIAITAFLLKSICSAIQITPWCPLSSSLTRLIDVSFLVHIRIKYCFERKLVINVIFEGPEDTMQVPNPMKTTVDDGHG